MPPRSCVSLEEPELRVATRDGAAEADGHLRRYLRGQQPFGECARRLRRLEIPVHVRRRRGTVI